MSLKGGSSIVVDVHFEGTESTRLQAIEHSARNLVEKMNNLGADGCIWNLTESLWPALLMPEFRQKPANVMLRLVPLSRIGQVEGKSGSLVLIGYFADAEDTTRPHSHPVVVKTLSVGRRNKLREEYDNAQQIKPYVYDQKDNFAIPIDFDDKQEAYHILWSIFSPSNPIWPLGITEPVGGSLRVTDLRTPLDEGRDNEARPILERTFEYLATLHNRLNKSYSEERRYDDEYSRYLRKLDEGEWGAEWQAAWGTKDKHLIQDAGGEFANPFYVLHKIGPLKKSIRIGAIHGDLHPGNIVLNGDQPRIIDFGWAQDCAHIAKDFVLMECNLRFHTLRPQLNQRDVYALADWVAWDTPVPTGLSRVCKETS